VERKGEISPTAMEQAQFMRACCMGDVAAAAALLKAGVVSVRQTEKLTDRTMLLLAACRGQFGMVKLLVRWGVDVKARSAAGRTALMEAAYWGHLPICKYLVTLGAEINEVDYVCANSAADLNQHTNDRCVVA
jgi:ankyrin repeat protein